MASSEATERSVSEEILTMEMADEADSQSNEVISGGNRFRTFTRIKRTKSAFLVKSKNKKSGIHRDFSVKEQKLNYLRSKFQSKENGNHSKTSTSSSSPQENGRSVSTSPCSDRGSTSPMNTESENSCTKCGKKIEDSSAIDFENRLFHVSCFNCAKCGANVAMSDHPILVLEGDPLCYECSPVCWSCSERITQSHMRVLDQDFHEDCLRCIRCNKQLKDSVKIYASEKHPCCASCVSPVFEKRSPVIRSSTRRKPRYRSLQNPSRLTVVDIPGISIHGPPRSQRAVTPDTTMMKHLSQSEPTLDSFEFEPAYLPTSNHTTPPRSRKTECSTLDGILQDEVGLTALINFCIKDCSIELVMFLLDIEAFKNFDGDKEDLKLIAQHVVIKYIAYAADMPVCLPKAIESKIIHSLENNVTHEMFETAQKYIYEVMEQTLYKRFLFSEDGLNYIEGIVKKDIEERRKSRDVLTGDDVHDKLKATVTNFDKRNDGSKYYVYQVAVTMGERHYTIYRRYSEFHALHQKLRTKYPLRVLPSLPKKILFGRSQVRAVASQRMKDLQKYLKDLLQTPPQVSTSNYVLEFLRQTVTDTEDEMFEKKLMNKLSK